MPTAPAASIQRRRRLKTAAAALALAALPWLPAGCGRDEPPAAPSVAPVPAGAYDSEGRALVPIPPPRATPNLILIVLDTLRADAVAVEEPARGAMPWLAGYARGAVSFSQASAPAPWTMPSLASLFTGLLPGEHRQLLFDQTPPPLGPLTCYAEVLARTYGYETAAFPATIHTEGTLDIWHGFDTQRPGFQLQAAEELLPAWAAARDRAKPFLLALHTYECHDPYGPANHPHPKPKNPTADPTLTAGLGPTPDPGEVVRRMLLDDGFRRAIRRFPPSGEAVASFQRYMFDGLARRPDPHLAAELHGAYRAGVGWVDGLLERTVALLERLGLLKGTLLVVTSDHGEAFGEHGALQHQRWLHEELLRVPLVLRGPAPFDKPRLLDASVGLIDVLPTFFDWAGMLAPPHVEGRSFLPLLLGADDEHVVLAEDVRMPPLSGGASHGVLASARSSRWKYVITHELLEGVAKEELYDLASDPDTRTNLLAAGAAPPAVHAAFAVGVERARERVHGPARRMLPAAPLPLTRRPAPLGTITR